MRLGPFSARALAMAALVVAAGACAHPKPVAAPKPAAPAPPPPPPPPPPAPPPEPQPPSDELEVLLRSDADMAAFMDDATKRRIQVLVAIPESPEGTPRLRRIGFRLDAEYFYPASAVKVFAAYGAGEKLDELAAEAGAGPKTVGLKTPVRFIEGDGPRRKIVKTTLQKELEKALVISDNEAYNRLFDFVGKSELAARLARIGLKQARIVQHLGDGPEPSVPPAIELLPPGGKPILVAQRLGFDPPPPLKSDEASLGNAHVNASGRVVAGPMDFSPKNTVGLGDLQDLLVAIGRPDLFDREKLRLRNDRREELAAILERLPSQLKINARAQKSKLKALDLFHKPVHVAVQRALPEHRIRVLEKDGRAFGFSVENAFVVDETTGRSFFVAATIYTNDDETLNDDQYDYERVGTPFLAKLGEVLAKNLLLSQPSK